MKSKQNRAPVSKDRALAHAQLVVRRAWAGGVRDFDGLGELEVDPKPLTIYDLNGEALFYDFAVRRKNGRAATVRTSATKLVGTAVPSVEIGPRRWDPDKALRKAEQKAAKEFKGARVRTTLVCYSYPKIGVRVDLIGRDGEETSVIYDASDLSPVTTMGMREVEGSTAWSYLDEMVGVDGDRRERLWDLRDRELEAVQAATPQMFELAYTAKEAKLYKKAFAETKWELVPLYSSRELAFGPRCDSHKCFELYAQETNVYCAVATGQMILDFYRFHFDQVDIATAMSTGSGGTSNPDQVAGYESLSSNCLEATYDTSAAWSEAKAEIDANRPVKSGSPGHARAVAGWKKQNVFLVWGSPSYWLKVYDPWPWSSDICDGGAVYWEDWDAVTHTNFIYVRHA